ncbi:hypothetical protein [Cellulomonas sp. RIT-PI-Y]|jgi:hypothetical protein|uniref:hypothetical protein n=1 Tax=Cellulomonas sp. RIT-PI-Y TaxID=3035297 RepID=UPI0021DA3905|nr:hypothetical protein [Cellulomonas sp. RIT-PI-Y]
MSTNPRDLTSDPAAEHLADHRLSEAELRTRDARSGGDPQRGPRSLQDAELLPDDEEIAATDDWDEPERL